MGDQHRGPYDPICERILLPGGGHPKWTAKQVELVKKRSRLFRHNILELRDGPDDPPWEIMTPFDGINSLVEKVVEKLGEDETDGESETVKRKDQGPWSVEEISRWCSAMRELEIIPERFPVQWTEPGTDSGEEVAKDGLHLAAGAPSQLAKCAQTVQMDDHTIVRQNRSQRTGTHRSINPNDWSWNSSFPYASPEERHVTSLHLANIALVLGWKAVFRRAIETLIWDWGLPATTQAKYTREAVACLELFGGGHLNHRRAEEMRALIDDLNKYINKQKKDRDYAEAARWTERVENIDVNLRDTTNLPPDSVYGVLRKIQKRLLDHQNYQNYQGAIPQPGAGPSRLVEGGGGDVVIQFLSSLSARLAAPDNRRPFAKAMLNEANNSLDRRQGELVETMLRCRNQEVRLWCGRTSIPPKQAASRKGKERVE